LGCWFVYINRALGRALMEATVQYVVTTFPILAPLPVSDNGSALGLFIFIRSFFSVSFLSCSYSFQNTDLLYTGIGVYYRLYGSPKSTQGETSRGIHSIATPGSGIILRRHSSNINTCRTFEESSARCIFGLLGSAVAGSARDICLGVIEYIVDERGADADCIG
jgi:hypothetical protein